MEAYALTVCDEPRHIPENQTIATGCLVRRGNINLISVSGRIREYVKKDMIVLEILVYSVHDFFLVQGDDLIMILTIYGIFKTYHHNVTLRLI